MNQFAKLNIVHLYLTQFQCEINIRVNLLIMKKIFLTAAIVIFQLSLFTFNLSAQTWSTTGNAGTTPGTNFIGTTDAKDFVFKTNATEKGRVKTNGLWQFGATTNLAKIDSGGNLSFAGSAGYKVAGNKYAFQYSGNPNYGLFFNSTSLLYEFRTSTALSVFSIGANSGNGIFKGNLKVGAYTLPATDGASGQVLKTNGAGVLTWSADNTGGGSGASTSLNNLTVTAINLSLIAGSDNTIDLGSSSIKWRDIYFGRKLFLNGSLFLHNTGTDNTWLGANTGASNGLGYGNCGIGSFALTSNTTGNFNTAIGSNALYSNEDGYMNTGVGEESLFNNISGTENVGIGFSALAYNLEGSYNTAIGSHALFNNLSTSNTATGTDALRYNTTGFGNSALGVGALAHNIDGQYNIAIGLGALFYNDQGSFNTAIGSLALQNTTGGSFPGSSFNIAIGYTAMNLNTTGNYNTSIGTAALYNTTTSARNSTLGYHAGYNYNNGDYNTFIGTYSDANTNGYSNSSALGDGVAITGSNMVRLGDASVSSIGGQVGWTTLSDGRFKKNVEENVVGLDFINQLRPVTYTVDASGLNRFLKIPDSVCNKPGVTEKEKIIYSGFIAQEVEASAKKVGYDFSGVDAPKNENDYYGLRYGDFVVPIVKSIQEISAENDSLKNENQNMKQQMNALTAKMNQFENALSQCCTSYQPTSTNVNGQLSMVNDVAKLEQNIPNPFNQSSYIKYFAPSSSQKIEITVSDLNGRVLKTFSNLMNGFGTVNINAGTLSAGTYQYTLFIDGNKIDTKQMVIVK